MANITDPFAKAIHGTNPQNLVEYITRQRIYDSPYWKESCFGLTTTDVATRAATQLKAIGGMYGATSKPTRFMCLLLKLLQIQPDEDVVAEFIHSEDFLYVRALGAFYIRMTGRPLDIYNLLEPCYRDYRRLRMREPKGWFVLGMDEWIEILLKKDRVCEIALPRLPKRIVLMDGGYLEGPRKSAMNDLLIIPKDKESQKNFRELVLTRLCQMARDGNKSAQIEATKRGLKWNEQDNNDELKVKLMVKPKDKISKKKKKNGNLFNFFKSDEENMIKDIRIKMTKDNKSLTKKEWNNERQKLGLKPLK